MAEHTPSPSQTDSVEAGASSQPPPSSSRWRVVPIIIIAICLLLAVPRLLYAIAIGGGWLMPAMLMLIAAVLVPLIRRRAPVVPNDRSEAPGRTYAAMVVRVCSLVWFLFAVAGLVLPYVIPVGEGPDAAMGHGLLLLLPNLVGLAFAFVGLVVAAVEFRRLRRIDLVVAICPIVGTVLMIALIFLLAALSLI